MNAVRRCASRLLTSRTPSRSPLLLSSSRSYTCFSATSARITSRSIVFQLQPQRRWATTDAEPGEKAPISKLQPTGPEEVENAIHEDNASTADPSAVAETANATETSNEALAAAETKESIVAKSSNATETTQEASPTAETQPAQAAAEAAAAAAASPGPGARGTDAFDKKPTVYVGNLFFDVTENDLIKEMTRFGTVNQVKVIRDARGLSKGFAYVDFATQDGADAAVDQLNLQLFEGRRVTVQYAARKMNSVDEGGRQSGPRKALNPPSKTLFIGNMSFEMTDRDLSNLFRGIRNVIDVRVAIDRRTGQPRGFAHADFIDVKSAMDAMKVLQEKETYGRKLRLDFSYSSGGAPRNEPRDDSQ